MAEAAEPGGTGTSGPTAAKDRILLCVVDASPELRVAIRFAARRALKSHGRVALLYVIEPADFQHWAAVAETMQAERREEAERVLHDLAAQVNDLAGAMPILYVREGQPRPVIEQVIREEPRISVLVLGASTEKKGPGPLVSQLAGKLSGKFPIPITVVPGNLTDEQIDALT